MSKNADLENLTYELKLLPEVIEDSFQNNDESVILARMVKGISAEKWMQACKKNELRNWHAISCKKGDTCGQENLALDENRFIAVSPFRDIAGVISHDRFLEVLKEELKRISRNGGSISILSCAVANSKTLKASLGATTINRLEALLASVLLEKMENCDSLGILRKGQFLCCLPGVGQLAARLFAEKAQKSFKSQFNSILSAIPDQVNVNCATGIVNLLQGDNYNIGKLINRCSVALEMALSRPDNYIYQEANMMPLENTTLVQSSEKRFLFFGE